MRDTPAKHTKGNYNASRPPRRQRSSDEEPNPRAPATRRASPLSRPALPVEADVNVLVVGSSTARRGAIGRHVPLPLIRRCRQPAPGRRLLRFLQAGWASGAGERPAEPRRGSGAGRRGCLCAGRGPGVRLPFLFINMADLGQQSRPSRSSRRLPAPSPTWRTQPDSSLAAQGCGAAASLQQRSTEQ